MAKKREREDERRHLSQPLGQTNDADQAAALPDHLGTLLQLQRSLGNRLVGHLLQHTKPDQQRAVSLPPLLQRALEAPPAALPYRSELEGSFRRSFGHVQAFLGAKELEPLGAHAATHGNKILFRSPTPSKALVAHELTHVVQQAQTAGYQRSEASKPGDPAEREANLAAQRAVAGRQIEVHQPPTAAVQFSYAALDKMGKARVDAQSEQLYLEKAEAYEEGLGRRLSNANEAIEVVNVMLDKVRQIVDAWATHTRQRRESVYKHEFSFPDGDKYFGAFDMSGSSIRKVFDTLNAGPLSNSQPLRKKLKIIYNAVRNNNLPKWLKVAADDMLEADAVAAHTKAQAAAVKVRRSDAGVRTDQGIDLGFTSGEKVRPGFAVTSGLDPVLRGNANLRTRVEEASNREKQDFTSTNFWGQQHTNKVHVSAPDMFSGLARGTPAESAQIDESNRDRLYGQNKGAKYADQRTVKVGDLPDLTSAEIRLLKQRRGDFALPITSRGTKQRFKANPNRKIEWEQGRDAITVMANSNVERAAADIGARLEAGISGSTNMMFTAAKNLGMDDMATLQKLRLAMLGWMIPNHDHSFYEIMKAADVQGVPFVVDPLRKGYHYEAPANFQPMAVAQFQNILPENAFPMHFLSDAYKDQLALTQQAQDNAGPPNQHDKANYRTQVQGFGLPAASVAAIDRRGLAELVGLHTRIVTTAFKNEAAGNADARRAARAANRLKHRYLRETAAYRYLVHTYPLHTEIWFGQLLAHAGKPLADDQQQMQGFDQAQMPGIDADDDARRQTLITDGVPASLLTRRNIVNDLLLFKAHIQTMAFDATKGVRDPANRPHFDAMRQTQIWRRLSTSLDGGVLNAVVATLLRAVHGGDVIYTSLLAPELISPAATQAITDGVPEPVVSSLASSRHQAVLMAELRRLVQEIDQRIRLSLPAGQAAALKALSADARFANLANVLDRQFTMVVASIASSKGINLAGDADLRTLAKAANVLNPRSTIATPANAAAAGFQPAGVTMAMDTLTQNLGGPVAGTDFALLDPVEIAAINAYTRLGGMGGAGSQAWQDNLSSLDTSNKHAADRLVKTAPKMEAAVSGLRKLPPYAGTVYSGTWSGGAAPDLAQVRQRFRIGSIHSKNNFLSTAKTAASSFIPKAGYHVAWVIDGVKTGRDIQAISTNHGEEEVLFAPGARFLVTKVEDHRNNAAMYNKFWVYLIEI